MSARTQIDAPATLDDEQVDALRGEFPILGRRVNGHRLVYLDNAATSQKPRCVIEAVAGFYEQTNANIHRGVHALSVEATRLYEDARAGVARFIGAERPEQIVFVRGATEAINLVAQADARPRLTPGDEVLITTMEHHSNIVPWQIVCKQTGAVVRVVPINDAGELEMDRFEALLTDRTRIVAVTHVSNALGTVNPIRRIADLVHARGGVLVVDGAQAAPHMPIDVAALDADFYAISGHKMFAPTGIGALYGRLDLLEQAEPYQGGGEMILSVTFDKTIYNHVPHKFEAGTPNIAGAIGLGAAVQYLGGIGMDRIHAREGDLLEYATRRLERVPALRLIGTARDKAAVLTFVLGDVHPHDVGTVLDQQGIAVRTGHHCAQPTMARFGVPATVRASLAFYNTRDEIDALGDALEQVARLFA